VEQLLKEICLEGFKSFRDKTVFKFDGPFTAIVGPNGSGKSNVVDAIKWVLGDQSPRSIRASTGLEAIFRPGDGKASDTFGYASVQIKIDNSGTESVDEPLAYDIERRYYRSGESIYSVNGKTARLKDVRSIMSRKGFGLGSLSVVSQGEIDGFLSLVPTDRRIVFEDLARISDFKANKRKMLGQLDDSARNLQRLQDLVGEIGVRADQLKIQAEAARRHAELSTDKQDLRAQLATQEYLLAKRNVERHESRLKEIVEEWERSGVAQTGTVESLSTCKVDLETSRKESAHVLASCEEGRRELDRARAEERRLTDSSGHLATLIHTIEDELADREQRVDKIKIREDELARIIELAEIECAQAHNRKLEYELYLSRRWGFMRVCERERERLASKVERLAGQGSLFARDAEFHNRRAETSRNELDKHRRRKVELGEEIEGSAFQSNQLTEKFDELDSVRIEKETILKDVREKLRSAESDREGKEKRASELTAEITGLEREHAVLEELEADREGYGEGVKAIIERIAEFPGLRGTIGELVKPEPGREQLIERALGDALEFLVCETLADAKKIIETARKDQLGTVTCLIRDRIPQIPVDDSGDNELLAYCSIDGDLYPALWMLLRGAKSCGTIDSDGPFDFTHVLVASDGDVWRPPSFLSGGSIGSIALGILTRRARLEQLDALLIDRRGQASSLDAELKEIVNLISQYKLEETNISAILEETRENLRSCSTEKQKSVELHEKLVTELASVGKRLKDVEIELESCIENARLASVSIESNKKVKLDAEADLQRIESLVVSVGPEVEDLRVRVQRAIVEEASYKEEGERARSETLRLEAESAQAIADVHVKRGNLEKARLEAQSTSLELKDAAGKCELLEAKVPEFEEAEKQASEKIEALAQAVTDAETALEAAREEVTRLEKAVHQQEIRVAELRGSLTGLERDLNAFPDFAERIQSGELVGKEILSKKELTERLSIIEAELIELGEVNPLAIEEEIHAKARLEELQGEKDDLVKAEEELRTALDEIEAQSEKAFVSTFDDARKRFAEVFGALFPGGSGELKLTDPDDPLESGIDVKVKFPNKGEMDLLQFSGGERSLIALALLFAILKVKPSSFTVLDEVEAALDDINTLKFLDYLGIEFPQRQFIMITHNKITMERASRLYGITMREAGVSQVVSVDLKKLKEEDIEEVLGVGKN
jgi:chromosome segregation protein